MIKKLLLFIFWLCLSTNTFAVESNGSYIAHDDCTSLDGWSERNDNTGDVTQETFDGKSVFRCDGFTNDSGTDYSSFYKDTAWTSGNIVISFGFYADNLQSINPANNCQGVFVRFVLGSDKIYVVYIGTNGLYYKDNGSTYTGVAIDSDLSFSADTWYDITFSINPSTNKITTYVDGSEVSTDKSIALCTLKYGYSTVGEIYFGAQAIQNIPCYFDYVSVGGSPPTPIITIID